MKYEVTWTTKQVATRSEHVMNYWKKVGDGAKEKLSQLSPAERDDKTHLGPASKLKRIAEAAAAQSWRAEIMMIQAKEVGTDRHWVWTNEDLLWFYPELASSEENLLQLGK